MRHGVSGRKLNRTTAHRLAMLRNMAQSLFEHGEIRTTIPKAKEVRRFAERLITLGIDGSLAARQRAIAVLGDRSIIPAEHRADYDKLSDAKREKVRVARSGRRYRSSTVRPGVKFTAESVIHRLFSKIGPQMKRRNERIGAAGGYTRIIRLADRRLGDGGQLAIVQLIDENDKGRPAASDRTERKRRAKTKYLFYAGKPHRTQRRRGSGRKAEAVAPRVESGAGEASKEE